MTPETIVNKAAIVTVAAAVGTLLSSLTAFFFSLGDLTLLLVPSGLLLGVIVGVFIALLSDKHDHHHPSAYAHH